MAFIILFSNSVFRATPSRSPYQAADSLLLAKLFTFLVSLEIFLEAVFL
jgi:hypothetical protein